MSLSQVYAKVIADSTYENGTRLTTMEVCFHRFVLAEFNTHRILNKNSASSRAIPVHKQIAKVRENPAIPLKFPAEQKGMQGGLDLNGIDRDYAEDIWRLAAKDAADRAESLSKLGVHKSVTNRILEPFLMHTVVVTGTSFKNFFDQRVSPLAQPEIREVATRMLGEYRKSEPRILENDQWHTPYISFSEYEDDCRGDWKIATASSAARCARVSYLTQDGKRDVALDLDLYHRLTEADPPHWSPLEHVATPWSANVQDGILPFNPLMSTKTAYARKDHLPKIGNLLRWRSLRTEVEAIGGIVTAA